MHFFSKLLLHYEYKKQYMSNIKEEQDKMTYTEKNVLVTTISPFNPFSKSHLKQNLQKHTFEPQTKSDSSQVYIWAVSFIFNNQNYISQSFLIL